MSKNNGMYKMMNLNLLVSTFILFLVSCQTHQQEEKLPNILFVVTDDMGQEVGCYGDKIARTPNIDEFAKVSYRFENAYVTAASCSPSRASILTGLYPHQNGQIGLSHRGFQMYDEFNTIPTWLKKQGYFTGILGKLHVEPHSALDFDYMMGGFDTPYKGKPSVMVKKPRELVDLDWNILTKVEKFTRMVRDVADTTASFIHQSGEKPFFLMINILDPHKPFYHQVDGYPENPIKPEEIELPGFMNREPTPELLNEVAGYYNGCTRADAAFGEVLKVLKESNEYDNTLIFFLGDHGAPLPRAKTTNYEAGLRIPFLMKLPNQEKAGFLEEYISTIDIFPTIIDLLGQQKHEELPGKSLVQKLKDVPGTNQVAFGDYNYHVGNSPDPRRSISTPKYKLIHHLFANELRDKLKNYSRDDFLSMNSIYSRKDLPEYEFYDLSNDPFELNNLANETKYADEREKLLSQLREWQEETNDSLWIDEGARQRFLDNADKLIEEALKKIK